MQDYKGMLAQLNGNIRLGREKSLTISLEIKGIHDYLVIRKTNTNIIDRWILLSKGTTAMYLVEQGYYLEKCGAYVSGIERGTICTSYWINERCNRLIRAKPNRLFLLTR